jgi:hypothetical protein
MTDVIVYRTRGMSPTVEREVARLRAELPDYVVAVVAYRADYNDPDAHFYGWPDIAALPYPGALRNIDPQKPIGHNDLPILKYYLRNPGFENYWVIEDDVRWPAPWRLLVDQLRTSDAALLATTVQMRAENPSWHYWGDQHTARAFLPFARASAACLGAIHEAYSDGLGGHYEGAWPTVCLARGLKIEDIGGTGSFTPARWRNRFYRNDPSTWNLSPGTFIWRPSFHEADFREFSGQFTEFPYLWHPVKP